MQYIYPSTYSAMFAFVGYIVQSNVVFPVSYLIPKQL